MVAMGLLRVTKVIHPYGYNLLGYLSIHRYIGTLGFYTLRFIT